MDRYHARVLERIAPQLESSARTWLEAACAPLTPDNVTAKPRPSPRGPIVTRGGAA
ncbi:M24 family metallopeptidase C-terminal domain-containing protein [Komagataeibacter rhaeticus]|nr:M24 family metallopeptidase C-terminal domain-containing protein [Komagataeibacter rhaeticus]